MCLCCLLIVNNLFTFFQIFRGSSFLSAPPLPLLPPCLKPICVQLSLSGSSEGNTCGAATDQFSATKLSLKKVPLWLGAATEAAGQSSQLLDFDTHAYNTFSYLIWFDIAHIELSFNLCFAIILPHSVIYIRCTLCPFSLARKWNKCGALLARHRSALSHEAFIKKSSPLAWSGHRSSRPK